MSDTAAEIGRKDVMAAAPKRREGWFAGGGVVGAVLASSCCIAPLFQRPPAKTSGPSRSLRRTGDGGRRFRRARC